jgi:hypothetical protein
MWNVDPTTQYDFKNTIPTVLVCDSLDSCLYMIQQVIGGNTVVPFVNIDVSTKQPSIAVYLDIRSERPMELDLKFLASRFMLFAPKGFAENEPVARIIFGGINPTSDEVLKRFLEHYTAAGQFCITVGYADQRYSRLPKPQFVKPVYAPSYTEIPTAELPQFILNDYKAGP